jgi:hypothetical protein
VDTGIFRFLQVIISTLGNPSMRYLLVAETNGTNGTGWITILTYLAARGVGAEQTTGSLFVDVYHNRYFGYTATLVVWEYRM